LIVFARSQNSCSVELVVSEQNVPIWAYISSSAITADVDSMMNRNMAMIVFISLPLLGVFDENPQRIL
jgi:hypothetical protein